MKTSLFTTERKRPEYYKGILIHADSMLHGQAEQLLLRYVSRGASVIDIGAGAGAFSQRMGDLGYEVTALDIDDKKFIPSEIPFIKRDINRGILLDNDKKYDAACAFEVIEHLENPWKFFRDVITHLKPGGYLILSTPNITSFLSRLLFLRNGIFHQFAKEDLSYGHINPMSSSGICLIAKEVGMEVVEIKEGGYLPVLDFSSFRFSMLVLNLLRLLAFMFVRGAKKGWCLIFVLKKYGA